MQGGSATDPGPLRWDREARHGTAVVGIVFAAFVTLTTDFSTVIQAASYAGTIPNDVPLVNLAQFLTVIAVYLVSFALVATTTMRRAVALTVVPLVLLGWAWLGTERAVGDAPYGDPVVWSVLLDQGTVTLVAALGGWLIARGLHPLSWIAILVALIPPIATSGVVSGGFDATISVILVQSVVVGSGLLGIAAALLIDRVARRTPRSGLLAPIPFGRSARYGVALGAVASATYLAIATDFTGYLEQSQLGDSAGTTLIGMLRFALILALFVFSFAVLPVSSDRRVAAVTIACVVLFLWAALGIERSVGNIPSTPVWFVLLNQGFIAVLVSLAGWTLVRGRHPLAFVVVALALVPPAVARVLDDASVTSGAYTLAIEGVVIASALAGGGIAWAIDAGMRRLARRGAPAPARPPRAPHPHERNTRPRAVTAVAVVTWIIGSVQILGGLFGLSGSRGTSVADGTVLLVGSLVTILVGATIVLAGAGLLQGRPAARILTTVFVSFSLLGAMGTAVVGDAVARTGGILVALLDVLTLLALWAGQSRGYFRAHRRGRDDGRVTEPAAENVPSRVAV